MKPIEPGCLALVVGYIYQPGNLGKCVKVIGPFDAVEGSWLASGDVKCEAMDGMAVFMDKHLLRIDDPDVEKQVVEAMEGHS